MKEVSKSILTRGVLGLGIPLFLITTGWDLFLNPRSNLRTTSHFMSLLLYNLFLCLLIGGLLRCAIWKVRRDKSEDQKPISG
jgi:hypothetical protein